MKKSLSCKSTFNDNENLKQSYLNFHNVDRYNYFVQKLFNTKQNNFAPKKCLCCNEFLTTTKSKQIPDFFKHYSDGKEAFENKASWYQVLWQYQNVLNFS